MRIEQVLPDRHRLQCDDVQVTDERITIFVRSTAPVAHCPLCNEASARVHSRYRRTLADLPWHGRQVKLCWSSRRFFCQNAECSRRIFTERLPEVGAPHARKTQRFESILTYLGLSCGGEGGARLANRLGMAASPDSLLRRIRRQPVPDLPTPRVLGIDDWAFRRGQRYGTILYDLERHLPIALLPERSPEAVAIWLKQHPGVEVVSRDRGDVYIKGAAADAPQAVQVADRFHLVRNLLQALARLLDRHSGQVLATVKAINQPRDSAREAPQPCSKSELNASERATSAKQRSQERRAERLRRYAAVIDLWRQHVSQREIARRLDLDRGTVLRYVRAGQFPERASRTYRRGAD